MWCFDTRDPIAKHGSLFLVLHLLQSIPGSWAHCLFAGRQPDTYWWAGPRCVPCIIHASQSSQYSFSNNNICRHTDKSMRCFTCYQSTYRPRRNVSKAFTTGSIIDQFKAMISTCPFTMKDITVFWGILEGFHYSLISKLQRQALKLNSAVWSTARMVYWKIHERKIVGGGRVQYLKWILKGVDINGIYFNLHHFELVSGPFCLNSGFASVSSWERCQRLPADELSGVCASQVESERLFR